MERKKAIYILIFITLISFGFSFSLYDLYVNTSKSYNYIGIVSSLLFGLSIILSVVDLRNKNISK